LITLWCLLSGLNAVALVLSLSQPSKAATPTYAAIVVLGLEADRFNPIENTPEE